MKSNMSESTYQNSQPVSNLDGTNQKASHLQGESILKLKSNVTVEEFIKESYQYHDLSLRANRCQESISVNKFLLAACSPLIKSYLEMDEEADQLIITDCCFTSLQFALHYACTGYVQVQDSDMREKVSLLTKWLQIGKFTFQPSKKESLDNVVSFIKEEPSNNEDNLVKSYLNYIEQLDNQNKSTETKNQWRDDLLNSLYKYSENDNDDMLMEDENYEEDEEEYSESKKKRPKAKLNKKFNCSDCGKSFNTQLKLKNHEIKKHTQSGNLKCEHCTKSFKTLCDKKAHEDTHTRPFKCDECDATFGRKSNLIGHMRVHRGERPYMCDICGKSFPMQSSVTTHKKQSHPSGDKPWVCEFCERR